MSARPIAPCPVCGGVTLAPDSRAAALLAVSDYLVGRALTKLGILLVRGGSRGGSRSFGGALRARGIDEGEAWRYYPAPADLVDKAIAQWTDDWRVIALMLDSSVAISPRQVQAVLTDYVHELAADRIPHTVDALRVRLEDSLGVALHDRIHEVAAVGP